MSIKEFTRHKFDTLTLLCTNVVLLLLVILFAIFDINVEVLKWIMGLEATAFGALMFALQATRAGGQRRDDDHHHIDPKV
jgi:hypothetical protein